MKSIISRSCLFLSVLCLLIAVFCRPASAGGSWLIDGKCTEVVEVETSATDYNALYTDGSRSMQAPLIFDPSVSSEETGLFNALILWEGASSDFFVFNSTDETLMLTPNGILGFAAGGLSTRAGVIRFPGETSVVDFGEHRLGGGWWLDTILDEPNAVIHKQFADNRYVQSSVENEDISLYCYADDPQQDHKKIIFNAAAPGVGDVTATVDPEEGFVVDDEWGRAARISSSSMRLGTSETEIEILGSEVYLYPDATDPDHALNRRTGDNRYHQKSAITTPLKFDSSLSSETTGLFKATVPWDAEYEFFTFNPTYETVVLSPTVSSLGFEAASLIMNGYGNIRLAGESTYISFEERLLGGGGWMTSSVMNDPWAIMNRAYADNRYVQQSAGITTNYTFQAGDVLQIQNGVITAINP